MATDPNDRIEEATESRDAVSGDMASKDTASKDTASKDTGSKDTVQAGATGDDVRAQADDGPIELDALDSGPFRAGARIAHYTLGERLGGGAMASVYRAVDDESGEEVALKLLLPGADAVMRERFRREARTASVLDHRHIVPTLEVGQAPAEGVAYIAMELVEGCSLNELLERHGRLSPDDACLVLAPIAEALAFAHARGIVHRDVKPSNILLQTVTEDVPGAVRLRVLEQPVAPLLSDFGIARALDAPDLTSAGRTIGTPAFMAPEQCAGSNEIDGRADIYALGAVLYRCLVGRAPFTGSTTQILHAHVYDPLMIPDEAVQRLPESVINILARAMMKEPALRYQDVRELGRILRTAAASYAAPEEAAGPVDDATRTMASLPVTAPSHSTTSRILVPAPPPRTPPRPAIAPQPSRTTVVPRGVAPAAGVSGSTTRTPAAASRASGRGREQRFGLWILGGALGVLLVLLGATLVSSTLAGVGLPGFGAEPTAVTVDVADDPAEPVQTAAGQGQPVSVAAETSAPLPTPVRAETVAPTPSGPTPTATVELPPAVPLASAWEDAQAFYLEQDWESALDWLIMVRRVDDEFEQARVESMMVVSYAGLATEASLRGQYARAVELWERALELEPENRDLLALYEATAAMAEGDQAERASTREVLQEAHANYAESLYLANEPCAAAEQINAAVRFLRTRAVLDRQAALVTACEDLLLAAEPVTLSGSIIYSAQEGDTYRILRRGVAPDAPSTLLVDNAAQPALSPNGRVIAFYSVRSDYQGLAGLDLAAMSDPNARSLRYTEYAEDARDAPPSWSPQSDRLAFTSTSFGDGRYRIYVTGANDDLRVETLGYGKDPAWHPWQDMLVFNGTDETGNQPGLWLMRPDGSGRSRLTDNGNDIRPVWTPDGSAVVFMSSGRDGNWEVYRVNVTDLSVVRLTSDPHQDGLPAVSPDGRYVAFMSDRDGYWRLYYVPIEGGEAQLLGDISGQLPRWLEHSVQWVN